MPSHSKNKPQDTDSGAGKRGGFFPRSRFQALIDSVVAAGYRCIGPQVQDGAIVYNTLHHADALPVGVSVEDAPGRYRLHRGDDARAFAWANGPQALKPLVFQPREPLWSARRTRDGALHFQDRQPVEPPALAVLGVRACDLAALALQDQHFLDHQQDPGYAARRQRLLLIAVNCTHPGATCFCASTGDGPEVTFGADIVLDELDDGYLVRAETEAGAEVVKPLRLAAADDEQHAAAKAAVDAAAEAQTRQLPGRNLRDALFNNLEHERWAQVADRCLACGNCVSVCPTCFCHAEYDVPSLDGSETEHVREWDSCFSAGHAYIHGVQIRPDIRTRYRQWLTHKLGGWHDQYGRSGCVGCGRCIAWCPVGIDITEEAAAVWGEDGS